jgi:hypothetical protein
MTRSIDWSSTHNVAGLSPGSKLSILGWGAESIALGRALSCGYTVFLSLWRDSKYDAVLDASGVMFRLSTKSTSTGDGINATAGWRAGKQINRSVLARTQKLSATDSDFLIGVDNRYGLCWIVPIEYCAIFSRETLASHHLKEFEEKWSLFSNPPSGIYLDDLREGFRSRPLAELKKIAGTLGVATPPPSFEFDFAPSNPRARSIRKLTPEDWYVASIWRAIYASIP